MILQAKAAILSAETASEDISAVTDRLNCESGQPQNINNDIKPFPTAINAEQEFMDTAEFRDYTSVAIHAKASDAVSTR